MLSFLYRGPLSSCNYGCEYCPFAKTKNSREELADDAHKLARFVSWVAAQEEATSVLFTPWGEALIRSAYQEALARLTTMQHVQVAAIQTNLSAEIGFVGDCDPSKLGIWATYHRDWCDREEFVRKAQELHELGVRISVGVVGFPNFAEEIERLRAELPEDLYLWINAAKSSVDYDRELIERFSAVDPNFATNTQYHASLGQSCRTGRDVFSVDGEGDLRRCHFVDTVLGNLYHDDLAALRVERPCPNQSCGCHIGYVHLDRLGLDKIYGQGILERIPTNQSSRH